MYFYRENKGNKKELDYEHHTLKAEWNMDYIVIKLDGKTLYLLSSDIIAVLKEYNMHQHFHI